MHICLCINFVILYLWINVFRKTRRLLFENSRNYLKQVIGPAKGQSIHAHMHTHTTHNALHQQHQQQTLSSSSSSQNYQKFIAAGNNTRRRGFCQIHESILRFFLFFSSASSEQCQQMIILFWFVKRVSSFRIFIFIFTFCYVLLLLFRLVLSER